MKLLDEMPLWLSQQNDADEQWKVDVNRNILKMAAACHDLGLIRGRESNMPNINVAGTDARYIFYY